jgi:hypothetical protein
MIFRKLILFFSSVLVNVSLKHNPFRHQIRIQLKTNIENALNSNENHNRVESLKTAFVSAVAGSFGALPVSLPEGFISYFNSQWEFSHDMLGISLFLYGIVYRYAVRKSNPGADPQQLQLGAIAAFSVTRTVSLIQVPSFCSSLPLNCGAPFYYFDWSMLASGLVFAIESLLAFGTASYAIEYACKYKLLAKYD